MPKFDTMPSRASGEGPSPKKSRAEKGHFFPPQAEMDEGLRENLGRAAQPKAEARERRVAPTLNAFFSEVRAVENDLMQAVENHSIELSDLTARAEDLRAQAEMVVQEARKRGLPEGEIHNMWKAQQWLRQMQERPFKAYETLKKEKVSSKAEAKPAQLGESAEAVARRNKAAQEMQMHELRQRIIAEYGIDPDTREEQGLSLANRLKHWASKLSGKGSLLDAYDKLKNAEKEELRREIPMHGAVPELARDLGASARNIRKAKLPEGVPSRGLSDGLHELTQDVRDLGANLREVGDMARQDVRGLKEAATNVRWGIPKAERRAERAKTPEETVKEFEDSFGIEETPAEAKPVREKKPRRERRVETPAEAAPAAAEEPITLPMEGRLESTLRDAAAGVLPGIDTLTEKQGKRLRREHGESTTPLTTDAAEFEASFGIEPEVPLREKVALQKAERKQKDAEWERMKQQEVQSQQTEEAVALHEAITAHNEEEERKAFRRKAAERLRQTAKPVHEAKVILSPEVQEEVDQAAMGKKQIEAAEARKKVRERDATLKPELVLMARGGRSADANLVNELNTKTNNNFYREASADWEKALKATQNALKAQGVEKASNAEALATRYVLAKARLKAAEMAGLDDKELGALRKKLDEEPAAYYIRSKTVEEPKTDEEKAELAYKARRNLPLEATPPSEREKQDAADAAKIVKLRKRPLDQDPTVRAKRDAILAAETPVPKDLTKELLQKADAEYAFQQGVSFREKPEEQDDEYETVDDSELLEAKKDKKPLAERIAERDARRAKRAERRARADAGARDSAERIAKVDAEKAADMEVLKQIAIGSKPLDKAAMDLVDKWAGNSLSPDDMATYEEAEAAGKKDKAKEYLDALVRSLAAALTLPKETSDFYRKDVERLKAELKGEAPAEKPRTQRGNRGRGGRNR